VSTPSTGPSRFPLVTLIDDPQFRGYVFARYVDGEDNNTGELAVDVSNPGHTELRGCVRLPLERLEVVG